jgi:hypothetical protein
MRFSYKILKNARNGKKKICDYPNARRILRIGGFFDVWRRSKRVTPAYTPQSTLSLRSQNAEKVGRGERLFSAKMAMTLKAKPCLSFMEEGCVYGALTYNAATKAVESVGNGACTGHLRFHACQSQRGNKRF